MAEVPPTPLLPIRMDEWMMEGESLLFNQQPIFGDESLMEMTFEMSRIEDADKIDLDAMNEGDDSTDTIVMPALARDVALDIGEHVDDDGDVEHTREAGEYLNRPEPVFSKGPGNDQACDYEVDPNDYYGDYPPSPFLNRSIRISRRAPLVDPPSVAPETENESSLHWELEIAHDDQYLASPTPRALDLDITELDDKDMEENSFTARGEKSTRGQRELESRPESMTGLLASESGLEQRTGSGIDIRSGSGNGSKRPAGSPRQSEKKKVKARSPRQDDYYSRRLSRSTSTTNASPLLRNANLPRQEARQSPSLSQKEINVAGPSRMSVTDSARSRISSPPIHASIPVLPIADQEDDTPPARPSLLSRLIARSSVLHPISSTSEKSSPSMSMPSSSSLPPSLSIQTSIPENVHTLDNEVEFARSRRSSDILPDHPVWDVQDVGPEDELMRPDDELSGLRYGSISAKSDVSIGSHRSSSSHFPGVPDLSRSTSSSRSHSATHLPNELDQALCDSTRRSRSSVSGSGDLGRCRPNSRQSLDEHFEHSIRSAGTQSSEADESRHDVSDGPTDLSASHRSQNLKHQRSPAGTEPSSPTTGTTMPIHSEVDTSLRRSTSQRVIGFFSDLLRSSTSSRSISDQIQTPNTSRSSKEEQPGQKELSLEDDHEEEDVETYQDQQGQHSSRNIDLDASSTSSYHTNYIPPPPQYIPLTRPNRAPISHTASRAANPIRQPRTASALQSKSKSSSFASAALARLPPPGKGSSSAGEKIIVKPLERASDLQARRALFEKSKNQPVFPVVPGKGKENAQKGSDGNVRARLEEKRKLREAEDRKRMIEEERAYRDNRKETIVRARPVPDMYRRKLH